MSAIKKIKDVFESLTPTDKKIAEYILKSPKDIFSLSSTILAEKSEVSVAAWNRFSTKLGYKGIPDLKFELAQSTIETNEPELDIILEKNDNIDTLIYKQSKMLISSIENTHSLIDNDKIQNAAETIAKANKIYLIGVGGSGIICDDFMQKLSRLGYNCEYLPSSDIMLPKIYHIKEKDVLFAISYSGKKNEVLLASEYAKKKGAKVICLTGYNINSQIVKNSDISLFVPRDEKNYRLGSIASRNSMLIITDLLYYQIALKNFDKTLETIIETRNIFEKIEKSK